MSCPLVFLCSLQLTPYTFCLFSNYKNSTPFTHFASSYIFSVESTTLAHRDHSWSPMMISFNTKYLHNHKISCVWVVYIGFYFTTDIVKHLRERIQYYNNSLGIPITSSMALGSRNTCWTKVSTLLTTYIISVNLMCQGRKPSVLSTGPNFNTKSGSGKPFEPWKEKKHT